MLKNAHAALPRQSAPASVCRRHRPALPVGEQQRQAVGHHHGASHAGGLGEAGIGHRAVRGLGMQHDDISAMHLVQKHGLRTQRRFQAGTVRGHMRRVVTDMVAQIEAVIRGA